MATKASKKTTAKKSTGKTRALSGKMSPRQALGKKAEPKTAPKSESDADAPVTLAQFREAAREYLRADENVKLYETRKKAQQPIVRRYVEDNAVDLEKGKSKGLVDNAVKWLLVPGQMKVNDDAGVTALQAAIAKAKGDRKRILEACLKPSIDKKAWESAKAVGVLDDELIAAYEQGRVYRLTWDHTDQVSCPDCRAVSTRGSKFCAQCGADLTKAPEHLK